LSSLCPPSSLEDDDTVELDVVELEVVELCVLVAPQRINDATPVNPILRMLMVAVRLAARFLPFVLMSTM